MIASQPFADGPYLSAAVICEKVLTEPDGIKSAIRIIDRLTRTAVMPVPPPEMEPFEYELAMLIKLKAGRARGTYPFRLHLVKPSGESRSPFEGSIHFEGEEDRGVDILVNLTVKFDQTGIYWFHIYLGDTQLTRIPFRIIYLSQTRRIHEPGEGPPPAQELPHDS